MQLSVPAFDLRISITDTEPLIWRRLQVPVTLTVPEFHLAVQAAFGWENSHLYAIRCEDRAGKPREIVGPQDLTEDLDAESASGVVLSELLDAQKPGSALEYEYDFGDSWTHHVEVFGSADIPAGELLCVDGANRGPVEDTGGPHGYTRMLQIVADPEHPEHADATSWIFGVTGEYGSHFAPATFDRQAANRKLRLLSLQWWPQPLIDWKLQRKFKGRLVLTPRGKRCLERPAELWDYLVDAVGRQEHDAVRLVTRVHTDWHLSGIAPTWNREMEAIRGAMLAAGFVTRSGHPIPDEWVSDINRVVRWNFECLHLTAPKVGPLDRALLTDGGVKFLLAVQAVGRSV